MRSFAGAHTFLLSRPYFASAGTGMTNLPSFSAISISAVLVDVDPERRYPGDLEVEHHVTAGILVG